MKDTATSFLAPQMISRLSSITLRARQRMEGTLAGIHESPHRGSSVEFLEHKRYTPGDDIRDIDWKLVARSDRLYIKQYENETNMRAIITIDGSTSMEYGPEGRTKLRCAKLMAGALSYLLLSQSDAVGLLSQSHEERLYVPPRSKWSHYRAIGRALDDLDASDKETWIRHLMNLVGTNANHQSGTGAFPKHGMFILFSDLLSDRDKIIRALQLLRDRRHDVILFHVLHPWELEFPFDSPRVFRAPENSTTEILADPQSVRDSYLERIQELQTFYQRESNRMDIDYHLISSDESLDEALIQYLHRREQLG
ncbi:MAG: DUF58 domain-containing protein [Planctomycetota bacterium]